MDFVSVNKNIEIYLYNNYTPSRVHCSLEIRQNHLRWLSHNGLMGRTERENILAYCVQLFYRIARISNF